MIDLSITKDPEWIKQREELWKPISKMLSEDLRKNELEKVHNYFMTGVLRPGEKMSDGAKISWFPIQTPEAWDYLFQYVVKDHKEFEHRFYFSFEDQSHRALNKDQELALWDYFIGNEFKPIVTSRVPIGDKKNFFSFEVDKWRVSANFVSFVDYWISGKRDYSNYKMKNRISYLITMLPYFSEQDFLEKDSDGDFLSNAAYCVNKLFVLVCSVNNDAINKSKELDSFISDLRSRLDEVKMPSAMKARWQEIKASNNQK